MTWYQLVYLQCDAGGCSAGVLGDTHREGMRATREKASYQGWRAWEGRDYCPDHSAPGSPEYAHSLRTVSLPHDPMMAPSGAPTENKTHERE